MKAALAGRAAAGPAGAQCQIIGVTVMTSLSQVDLDEMGYGMALSDLVMRRVDQAVACGLDGVVASPQEAEAIRSRVPKEFLIVTPGVRPEGAAIDDQHRIATPASALLAGASHLVIGRPVTRAPDPKAAIQAIRAGLPTL